MTVRNLTIDGGEYVLIPRKQWEAFSRRSGTAIPKNGKAPPPANGYYTIEHVRASLAHKIASQRKAAGLTQARLAKLSRVRVETISRLESGLHMPGAATFEKIERGLERATRRPAA